VRCLEALLPLHQADFALVGSVIELHLIRDEIDEVVAEVAARTGSRSRSRSAPMIELPRGALTAGRIAEAAEFFSFGTNDLTQMTWGFSRVDVEASIFATFSTAVCSS
jgi:pyruvate, orthophosphate dikinase